MLESRVRPLATLLLCALLVWAPGAGADAAAEPAPKSAAEREPTTPEDQFWRGFNLLYGRGVEKDVAASTPWFRRAADQGHLRAQVHMGMAYQKGRGVEPDPAEAQRWLLLAAEQGHPKAQFESGLAFWEGRGVARDRIEGLKWLLLSLRAGGPMARAKVPHYVKAATPKQRKAAQTRADEWRAAHGLPLAGPQPGPEAPPEGA